MQFASMHFHKHTLGSRWLNCAPMHLQSQIQPLMAPTCMNASLHTQNALNNLLHQCLLTHSECTQPTLASMPPYTLRMHLTNSCINASHTQNALNQLLHQCLLNNSIKTYNAGLHIQCFEIPPKSTNPGLVHLQTPNGLQTFKAPPRFFKIPPRLPKAPPRTL